MQPRLLLDTHVVVRWLFNARKLSRDQARVLEGAVRRNEPLAFIAISILEIAILVGEGKLKLTMSLNQLLAVLQTNPAFRLLPLTYEIASDLAVLGLLRDPADRAITATARVHRLSLVTSDTRIIESNLVPVVP